jgi:hypothetical protein
MCVVHGRWLLWPGLARARRRLHGGQRAFPRTPPDARSNVRSRLEEQWMGGHATQLAARPASLLPSTGFAWATLGPTYA